jgi:hypothetical protein
MGLEDIRESDGIVPPFLTFASDRGDWSASRSCCFIPVETSPGTNRTGGLMGPSADPDATKTRKHLIKNHIMTFLSYDTEQPTTMAQAVTLLIRHELLVLHIFDTEHGDNIFIRNIG